MSPLRVLQISHADNHWGGAGVSAHRLHRAMLDSGIDAYMMSGTIRSPEPRTRLVPRRPRRERLIAGVSGALGLNDVQFVGAFRLADDPWFQNADVVHYHALHGNTYFSYLALARLTRAKPSIMTLHDMWPFTGHCAFSYDSERWRTGCGDCPHLDTFPPVPRDATWLEWRLKRFVYSRSQMDIVAPSEWLRRLAAESLLQRFRIHHIPYGLDTNVFAPKDRAACRRALQIEDGKVVLLFGAASLDDRRKGADLLLRALQSVAPSARQRTTLLLMGGQGQELARRYRMAGYDVRDLDYVEDDAAKASAYAAADYLLFPSRADNLPLTILESLACGTPVIATGVGGVPELVREGVTGYLVQPDNAAELAQRIEASLEAPPAAMRERCRELACREYGIALQVARYRSLFEDVRRRFEGNAR